MFYWIAFKVVKVWMNVHNGYKNSITRIRRHCFSIFFETRWSFLPNELLLLTSTLFWNDCVELLSDWCANQSFFHLIVDDIFRIEIGHCKLNGKFENKNRMRTTFFSFSFTMLFRKHQDSDSSFDFDYTLIAINLWNFACRFV